MLLREIKAEGFLSFGQLVRLRTDPGLTIVSGPNAAGKSNLGRCLALARAVVTSRDEPEAAWLELFRDAGYEGREEFTVWLDIKLDQQWERDLVLAFVRACFATGQRSQSPEGEASRAAELDAAVTAWLTAESLAPLWHGTLVIRHRAPANRPWSAAWQFSMAGDTWHAVLAGDKGTQQLRPGAAEQAAQDSSAGSFTDWLMNTKPQDAASLDFRIAMEETGQPVLFAVRPVAGGPAEMPASVRDLGSALGIDLSDREADFGHVVELVLRRGIVLTDNRRVPLRREFTVPELGRPADLRDGAAVAGELFRLKMGYPVDQARFREIQATFRELTGRDLEVRSRPAGPDSEGLLIIEPTVTGFHGVRLVELSGAGMQEALVLSAILRGQPGQVTVLDEPAVNLETTVQRRLISKLRGQGQYLMITHSADLVPFDEVSDLSRIVHVTPTASGSLIYQPKFTDEDARTVLRQLRLLEPRDVRGLLFAAGVILCEGETEVGALPHWWQKAGTSGPPDPGTANLALRSVGGQSGFGPYLRYLDAFGVPWVIVADGPALRPGSKLTCDLQELGMWPKTQAPRDRAGFAQWREFFECVGIYTLADQFGDDGRKGGEFEALLERTDSKLLNEARRAERGKPRQGAYFALQHSEPPPGIRELYEKITDRLGIRAYG